MRSFLVLLVTGAVVVGAPHVVAKVKVPAGTAPCAAAAGGKWVWVSEYGQPNLLKIDPRTNKVAGKSAVGFGACGLAYGAGSMWVEDTTSSTVSRVSVTTGKRRAIKVGTTPYDATFAYGSAWTTAYRGDELERIDPAKNRVVNRWKITAPIGVVGAFGSVWAAGTNGVIRVDPGTHAVLATIAIPGGAQWTAASADAVWVTTPAGLARIDPATNAVVATISLASAPYLGDPDVLNGLVWVPQIRQSSIAVIDPASNTVVRTIPTGPGPFVVTAIAGNAWVPSWHGSDVRRFAP